MHNLIWYFLLIKSVTSVILYISDIKPPQIEASLIISLWVKFKPRECSGSLRFPDSACFFLLFCFSFNKRGFFFRAVMRMQSVLVPDQFFSINSCDVFFFSTSVTAHPVTSNRNDFTYRQHPQQYKILFFYSNDTYRHWNLSIAQHKDYTQVSSCLNLIKGSEAGARSSLWPSLRRLNVKRKKCLSKGKKLPVGLHALCGDIIRCFE